MKSDLLLGYDTCEKKVYVLQLPFQINNNCVMNKSQTYSPLLKTCQLWHYASIVTGKSPDSSSPLWNCGILTVANQNKFPLINWRLVADVISLEFKCTLEVRDGALFLSFYLGWRHGREQKDYLHFDFPWLYLVYPMDRFWSCVVSIVSYRCGAWLPHIRATRMPYDFLNLFLNLTQRYLSRRICTTISSKKHLSSSSLRNYCPRRMLVIL